MNKPKVIITEPADMAALHQASERGGAEAQYELGGAYYSSEGVAEDKAEAAKWLRLAAEQGHDAARVMLKCYRLLAAREQA
jgi:TPR repeat protein